MKGIIAQIAYGVVEEIFKSSCQVLPGEIKRKYLTRTLSLKTLDKC